MKSFKRRLLKRLGKRVFRGTDAFFGRTSLVPDVPVLPRRCTPWLDELERASPEIRREVDALLQARDLLPRFQDIAANQTRISPDDKWRVFALAWERRAGGRLRQNASPKVR